MKNNYINLIIFTVLIALIPFIIEDSYYLSIVIFAGIFSIVTLGLNLLLGYAGQISLGHAAFYAIGAYTSAILTLRYNVSFVAAFAATMTITAVVAYCIGVPSLRLKGHYLAMATLAFGEIVHIFLNAYVELTGGPSGLPGIPFLNIGGLVFDNDIKYYTLVWGVFIFLFFITANIINSRQGRALRSIHTSETAACSLGINVADLKVKIFVLSALYAATAGVLYAHYVTFISPQTSDLMLSIRFVTMVVIGGMGHIWGGVVGAFILTILPEQLRAFEDYDVLIYGFILVIILMFMPGGLTKAVSVLYSRSKSLFRDKD